MLSKTFKEIAIVKTMFLVFEIIHFKHWIISVAMGDIVQVILFKNAAIGI